MTCSVVALVAFSCGTDPEASGTDASTDASSDTDSTADAGDGAMADADADANGSDDADAAVDGGDGSHCSALEETACLADPICMRLYGKPLPSGSLRYVNCTVSCGGALPTCAIDPNGVCWIFPSTCVPVGWTKVWECEPTECAGAFDAGPW